MRNNLVLGFDSWVGGAHNFQRLYFPFSEAGLDLRLLHIGSWGGDVGRPKEEVFGEMPVRDISYYEGMDLFDILKQEKPCAVLFLSNDVFAHRAMNRYCQALKIPTIHLYHGLVGIQSVESKKLYKVNPIRQMVYVAERVPKALKYIWPLYLKSLYRTGAKADEWLRFFSDVFNMTAGRYIATAARDSRTNGCCIYTQADAKHAKSKYRYSDDEISVVGNPDLSKFGINEKELGIGLNSKRQIINDVVYIDTGLIYAGMVFAGADDFLQHLTILHADLKKQDLSLTVKLHPDHFRTNLPIKIAQQGIRVLKNEDFIEALSQCTAAIVEPSTAALIPALLGLPVLLASFGKLAGQKYGNVLHDYPRAAVLMDTTQIRQLISRTAICDDGSVESWTRDNSGPLPSDQMPRRVAEVIKYLVGEKS